MPNAPGAAPPGREGLVVLGARDDPAGVGVHLYVVAAHVDVPHESPRVVLEVDLVQVARSRRAGGADRLLLADLGLRQELPAVIEPRGRAARARAREGAHSSKPRS